MEIVTDRMPNYLLFRKQIPADANYEITDNRPNLAIRINSPLQKHASKIPSGRQSY